MNNQNEQNAQYDLENIINNITNYLIDNDIIINDDDTNYIKFIKYVLKYKRFISIICLIILLIIGYYCDPFHLYDNKDNKDNKDLSNNHIQSGGAAAAVATARKAELKGIAEKGKADRKAAAEKAVTDKAAATKAKADAKAAGPGKIEKKAASGQAKIDAHKQAAKDFGKKATSLSTYTGAVSGAAGAAGELISNNADLIFQVFYSIAIFILICIVTIPAIAFVGIGIICYVLLKPKMEALKAL